MGHISGQNDADLHNVDGSHRTTAPTADGRRVAQYERRIAAHMQAHKQQAGRNLQTQSVLS